MLSCEYCSGAIEPGITDCPHCGASLIVEKKSLTPSEPPSSQPIYSFSPVYHKWLVFEQNVVAIIFISIILGNFYISSLLIPASLVFTTHPVRTAGIILSLYPLAFYLAMLTILAFYKKSAKQKNCTVYHNKVEYVDNKIKRSYPISSITNVNIKQSQGQAKYRLGTITLDFSLTVPSRPKPLPFSIILKNVEKPNEIYNKILELKSNLKTKSI